MDILKEIGKFYDFQDMTWLVPEQTFTSNRGNKKILYWQDPNLLDWHISWRDEVGRQQQYLVDRMIRTKDYKAFILVGKQLITIHDAEMDADCRSLDEKVVGACIGNMLRFGHESNGLGFIEETPFPQELLVRQIDNNMLSGEDQKLLARIVTEARKRLKLSNSLAGNASAPITDKIASLEQCKEIFGILYWRGSNDAPQNAYVSLRNFLGDWKNRYGEKSLHNLLDEMHAVFPLNKEQGNLLLAEIVKPWEVTNLLKELQNFDSAHEQQEALEQFKKEWESQRQLVNVVADWIDLSRKKVVQ